MHGGMTPMRAEVAGVEVAGVDSVARRMMGRATVMMMTPGFGGCGEGGPEQGKEKARKGGAGNSAVHITLEH
jgi:hypothetical protein